MLSQLFIFFAGIALLPLLFRLALKLRLGIPMLYAVLALTLFHDWTRANPTLTDNILFALVGLVILSWVVTGARKLWEFIGQRREDHVTAELFVHRVRQARSNGEYALRTGDPWY